MLQAWDRQNFQTSDKNTIFRLKSRNSKQQTSALSPINCQSINYHQNLLTYLFGRYNLLQVLASAKIRRQTPQAFGAWRQFRADQFTKDVSMLA